MAYRIEPHEALSAGLRRAAKDELLGASRSLTAAQDLVRGGASGASDPLADPIHDARKRFKKLRALVALVRTDLGAARAKALDRRFRDAGRHLSALRDAGVLTGTLAALEAASPERGAKKAFRSARKGLAAQGQDALAPEAVLEGLAAALEVLQGLEEDLAGWPLTDRWKALSPNLKRTYKGGRRALVQAYAAPNGRGTDGGDERFHTWRKAVKRLWYHLRLLHPLWPEVLAVHAAQAGALADLLGEENDLAVLSRTLQAEPERFGGAASVQALLELSSYRRHALRASAYPLGRRLYAEGPQPFVERLEGYWGAWQRSVISQT